jgi:HK97 family phage major capsid protein
VDSRNHRDILERYGKGGDSGLSPNEIFAPFQKDMYLASTSLGSNLVAPDFRFDVITPRTVAPVMPRICQTISTTVTSVTIPKNNDTNSDTRYGTTFRPSKGESPNGTANKKDTGPFGQMVITANTGSMFSDVSRDFFQDAPSLSNYLQSEASKAFAAVVDDEVINGITGSFQAEGLLTNSGIGITKTGTANTLIPTKITDAYYAFRQQYSPSLSWVMARGTHGKLLQLLDGANRPLFLPNSLAGYTQSPQPDILGSPVYFNEFMPASGASSPKSIIVGNFSEYFLLMRQGFTVLVDDISLAYLNRIRVSFSYRFGGAVRDPKAFQIVHEAV